MRNIVINLSGGSTISRIRGRQLQRWGHQPIILVNFLQKLQEIGKSWIQRGRPWSPFRSANESVSNTTADPTRHGPVIFAQGCYNPNHKRIQ